MSGTGSARHRPHWPPATSTSSSKRLTWRASSSSAKAPPTRAGTGIRSTWPPCSGPWRRQLATDLETIRETRPETWRRLWQWVKAFTRVEIAHTPVCRRHRPPFDFFAAWQFEEAPQAIVLGPRGGGKSFLAALDTHLKSRFRPRYK